MSTDSGSDGPATDSAETQAEKSDGPKRKSRAMEPEIKALHEISLIMGDLDLEQQVRVVCWITNRYSPRMEP